MPGLITTSLYVLCCPMYPWVHCIICPSCAKDTIIADNAHVFRPSPTIDMLGGGEATHGLDGNGESLYWTEIVKA